MTVLPPVGLPGRAGWRPSTGVHGRRASWLDFRVPTLRHNPARWLVVASALAWVALVVITLTTDMDHGSLGRNSPTDGDVAGVTAPPPVEHAHHATGGADPDAALRSADAADNGGADGADGMADSFDAGRLVSWVPTWTLMVVAMMWPLSTADVTAIGRSSFRRWTSTLVGTYLVATTGLWLGFGAVTVGLFQLLPSGVSRWLAVGLVVGAAVSTRSAWRALVLRRCGRLGALASAGWPGLGTSLRAAWRSWRRCALLCSVVMVAMAASHSLSLMVGGSLAVWWEQRHPRAWPDPVPAALLGLAALSLLVPFTGSSD